jgi:hypothetical protein
MNLYEKMKWSRDNDPPNPMGRRLLLDTHQLDAVVRLVDAADGLFVNQNGITDPDDPEFVSMWKAIGRVREALVPFGEES